MFSFSLKIINIQTPLSKYTRCLKLLNFSYLNGLSSRDCEFQNSFSYRIFTYNEVRKKITTFTLNLDILTTQTYQPGENHHDKAK